MGQRNLKKRFQDIVNGMKRILHAFGYSYDGFRAIVKSEPAFRQDLAVFVIFSCIALMLDVTVCQRVLMISSLFLILFAECVNTAFEVTINRISSDIHPLSKVVKDIGSLIVLLSFANAIAVWAVILL